MATSLSMFACLSLLVRVSGSKTVEIEAMKHDIQQISAANFDGVIGKFRDSQVSALWFFKTSNPEDVKLLSTYNEVAKSLKGMLKVCAMNCDDHAAFCAKSKVTTTPSIMIYPPNPMPAFLYEGKLETKALAGKLQKFIPDSSTRVTADNIDAFLTTDPSKPKVLLFSDKKGTPTILKALSSDQVYKRTLKFGFVTDQDTEVVKKMKVTKFPTLISITGGKADKKDMYKGEMKYMDIKDWINPLSESGTGDTVMKGGKTESSESAEEAKPWLVQEVPELTVKSQSDICFKGEGLCVIYLKDGEVSEADTEMLTRLSKKYTSQLSDRGAKMKWMWMNLKLEDKFKTLFAPAQLPSMVVFNPHRRLRFANLDHGEDNEIKGDEQSIINLMDKVLGGDARFKVVPGQKLPGWAPRDDASKKKQEL